MRIATFISYAHNDCGLIAHTLKEDILKRFLGFDAYVAHDDIRAGVDFNRDIQTHLYNAHVFLPVLSCGAEQSAYVNQEIGMAIALRKPIIPISITVRPFGFIKPLQSLVFPQNVQEKKRWIAYVHFALRIYSSLFVAYPELQLLVIESLTHALDKAHTFFVANAVSQIISTALETVNFNQTQRLNICNAIMQNRYVNTEQYIVPRLKKILSCC